MVVREFYKTREDGVNLYRTYSDEGYYILQTQTGIEYSEAVDVAPIRYTYIETDRLIEEDTENFEAVEPEEFLYV